MPLLHKQFSSHLRRLAAGLALLASVPAFATDWDAGLLYDTFSLALGAGYQEEALGPVYYKRHIDERTTWGVPPLFTDDFDKGTDSREIDILYPLLSYDRFGLEYRFHILQVINWSGGTTMDEVPKKRVTLFPFYFQQRSPQPDLNYTAFLPFYGTLKNRLFRDEIHFVMLPLYLQTKKRDLVTDNYLAPFFHIRHGYNLKGWQFWPLVGKETKTPGTSTNGFGDVEVVGGHKKFFALWPFYFNNTLGIGTTNEMTQKVLLPAYSIQRSPARDSTTYFWPFGFTKTVDREKQYTEWGAPWPIIDFARGEGKTINRVWPFFSQAKTPILQSDFYLWPIYKYNRAHSDPLDRERTRILFFLYSDLNEKNTAAGTSFHRTDLWPLFTARQEHDGRKRLQVLSILEPLLPASKSIERNYSQLWALWRSEENPKTGASSKSLLWNLYRQDKTKVGTKTTALFGLFRHERLEGKTKWRLFYIPWTTSQKQHMISGSKTEGASLGAGPSK